MLENFRKTGVAAAIATIATEAFAAQTMSDSPPKQMTEQIQEQAQRQGPDAPTPDLADFPQIPVFSGDESCLDHLSL